jgi:hypothetical protein
MGDRAYVEIVCREEDEPLFEALEFMQEFRHALPANVVRMVDAEASEGATTELQALAEKGIVFRGWHDAGGSYDGACFASVGGIYHEVPRLNHSDLPCVEVHVDGTVDAAQLLAACEYLKVSNQAGEALGFPAGIEPEDEAP